MKLFALIFVLLISVRTVAQPTLITLYATSIELNATGQTDTQRIPFKLDASITGASTLQIRYGKPVYVKLDKRFDVSYLEAVKIKVIVDSVPSLEISTDLSILNRPGTYEMLLTFTASGKSPQDVILSIIRPAAKFEIVPVIHINMVGGEIEFSDPLVLNETGNLSSINSLKFNSPFFGGANKDSIITFPATNVKINAGARTQVIYVPNKSEIDNLPLGKITGKLEINAPELTAPIIVDFEVLNKRNGWWIVLVIFLGTLFGAFVRYYVKDRKELEARKIEASDLLEKINGEMKDIQDDDFQRDVNEITNGLEQAVSSEKDSFPSINNGELDKLNALITSTASKYNDARNAFDDRRKRAAEKIKTIGPVFGRNNLHLFIKENIESAKGFYMNAVDLLNKGSVKAAEDEIISFIDSLQNFLNNFSNAITRFINAVKSDVPTESIFPIQIAPEFKTQLRNLNLGLETENQKIKDYGGNVQEIVTGIKAADLVLLKMQGIIDYLIEKMQATADAIYAKKENNELDAYMAAFEAWKKSIQELLKKPLGLIDFNTKEKLDKAYMEVINKNLAGGAIKDLINRPEISVREEQKQFIGSGVNFILSGYRGASIKVAATRARKNWFLFSIIQLVFTFGLMALAAYRFYESTFIGTIGEMIGLFLFAFGLDITVDNVYALRDKKV